MKYTLDDFNRIMFGGIQQELPKETIDLITTIANQVGATDYIRTPQFPKRAHQPGAGIGETTVNRRRQKTQEINDNDWDVIRNFQTTELKKNEGVQASIDEIRKHLNKITKKHTTKCSLKFVTKLIKLLDVGATRCQRLENPFSQSPVEIHFIQTCTLRCTNH